MKELEQKICEESKVLPGNVLKVDNFLNHQIDISFLMKMGQEVAELFKNCKIDKIVTIEASGIAVGVAVAAAMGLPLVFAKKSKTSNIDKDVYSARVHSYTHNKEYDIVISKEFLSSGEKILIVDDFLATGNALKALISIANEAQISIVGVAIAIEKAFQKGGDTVRSMGIRVESLARIASMDEKKGIVFIA